MKQLFEYKNNYLKILKYYVFVIKISVYLLIYLENDLSRNILGKEVKYSKKIYDKSVFTDGVILSVDVLGYVVSVLTLNNNLLFT